jgi:hypothetical protein
MRNAMNVTHLCLLVGLALPIAFARAADAPDAGVVSLVEGSARVLRDTTWYKLAPGARFREGDIVVAKAASQVQVELPSAGSFNLTGPGTLFAAAVPVVGDKISGVTVLALPEGWLKLVANAPGAGFRAQLDVASVDASDAIIVVHAQPEAVELFVESGAARVSDATAGKSAAANEMKAGEYAAQSADRPLRFERRAPGAFVATIPRHLIDPLPALAGRYKSAKVQLAAEQEITYAEAEPWLAGPYRKVFLKRFAPRLKDREFRAGVEAHITRYPEWDRMLHPEKYAPKTPVQAK